VLTTNREGTSSLAAEKLINPDKAVEERPFKAVEERPFRAA